MSGQRSCGWQSKWIVNTVGEPACRGRPIATLQSMTTPWQGLGMWHPRLQNRQQSNLLLMDTLDPEVLKDLEESASFSAPTRSHSGGFPQSPVPPTRCLQSQSLVTGETLDTLEVPQDSLWAMRQNRHLFAAIEAAGFASPIRSYNVEETTRLICPSQFLVFVPRCGAHISTGMVSLWFVCASVTGV